MKTIIKTVIISLSISLFFALNPVAANNSEKIVIKTIIYCDHCKECSSCSGKIEKDLGFNKGIKLVKLDEKSMTITVTFNPKKTSADEIRQSISKYGYDADDVKADQEAYLKLDDCCKKQ